MNAIKLIVLALTCAAGFAVDTLPGGGGSYCYNAAAACYNCCDDYCYDDCCDCAAYYYYNANDNGQGRRLEAAESFAPEAGPEARPEAHQDKKRARLL